jgi:hypothetical protein
MPFHVALAAPQNVFLGLFDFFMTGVIVHTLHEATPGSFW